MKKLDDLIDEMTEAEYLCMTDMKWVADRIREFNNEQAQGLTPHSWEVINELSELVDGAIDIIEIYDAQSPASKAWKRNWIDKAHKRGFYGQ